MDTRISSQTKRHPSVRKQPRQARSKQTVDAILQAAAELFADLGYAQTTTNKIADRAGVSIGSLYQYFSNKDSLLASLLAQHRKEVNGVVDRGVAALRHHATTLEVCIGQILLELVAIHEANPALTKALSASNLRESPTAHRALSHEREAETRIVCTILASRPDVREGDYAVMAAVLGQTMEQLTRWLVHDAPAELDREVLVRETVQLLVRFVRA